MTENNPGKNGMPRWMRLLITPLIIIGAGLFIWSQLPTGSYPTDMSRIGDGRPALVLTYDLAFLSGQAVIEMMNEVRDRYEPHMHFLIANLGEPQGRAVAERNNVGDGAVLLFSETGERLFLFYPRNTQELVQGIDQTFRFGAAY